MKHISPHIMALAFSALLAASSFAETPPTPSSALTQDEIDQLNSLEQEWAQNIDNAVQFIRQKDSRDALNYTKKADAVISEMKAILIKRGYVLGSIDRLVAMENLTGAYTNLAKIAAYTRMSSITVNDFNNMRALFDDTRKKLIVAEAKFHELPKIQDVCRQFLGVLDEFEREVLRLTRS